MDAFWLLALGTVFLRGLGSGMIAGILTLTMPVRRRMEFSVYAHFIRTMYRAWGVKIYAAITMLGFLMTTVLLIWSVARGESSEVITWVTISLVATCAGFIGTAGAFPTMKKLWATPDGQLDTVATLLSRFEHWGVFSASSHVFAFMTLLGALYAR